MKMPPTPPPSTAHDSESTENLDSLLSDELKANAPGPANRSSVLDLLMAKAKENSRKPFTYIASGIAVRAQSYSGPVHESEDAVIWTRDSDKELFFHVFRQIRGVQANLLLGTLTGGPNITAIKTRLLELKTMGKKIWEERTKAEQLHMTALTGAVPPLPKLSNTLYGYCKDFKHHGPSQGPQKSSSPSTFSSSSSGGVKQPVFPISGSKFTKVAPRSKKQKTTDSSTLSSSGDCPGSKESMSGLEDENKRKSDLAPRPLLTSKSLGRIQPATPQRQMKQKSADKPIPGSSRARQSSEETTAKDETTNSKSTFNHAVSSQTAPPKSVTTTPSGFLPANQENISNEKSAKKPDPDDSRKRRHSSPEEPVYRLKNPRKNTRKAGESRENKRKRHGDDANSDDETQSSEEDNRIDSDLDLELCLESAMKQDDGEEDGGGKGSGDEEDNHAEDGDVEGIDEEAAEKPESSDDDNDNDGHL